MKLPQVSFLQKILHVSISGMQAQANRLLVIAQNLANAGSQAPKPGINPYQRKTISFESSFDKKKGIEVVKVKKIGVDAAPFPMVYAPGAPGANDQGYVEESNVKSTVEMTDMLEARRGYEANLNAYKKSLEMQNAALSILRGGSGA